MNALLNKEVRLMLPVCGAALLLAAAPTWITSETLALYLFGFAALLAALSSFGREFNLNTFQVMLAQPLERRHIWRAKLTVLTTVMFALYAVWVLSRVALSYFQRDPASAYFIGSPYANVPPPPPFDWLDTFVRGATIILVIFSGGLWTTLLLRQVTAPFWFTALLPATLATLVSVCGGGDAATFIALFAYSIAGFWLARKLFYQAQETAWTGGTLEFPGWKSAHAASASVTRKRRPWRAMVRKEFKLHQFALAGMGVLFVLHTATFLFDHGGADSKLASTARTVSLLCALLWFVVPLIMGATSVADERRLGTMEAHLCLPVSSRMQFVFKVFFVVLFGAILSALLFWTKGRVGSSLLGLSERYNDTPFGNSIGGLYFLMLLFTCIALLGFYASTLTRNIMHALAAGVVTVGFVFALATFFASPYNFQVAGLWPWRGGLIYLIGVPTMVLVFASLAYRNYRRLPEAGRLWRRNLLTLFGAVLFTGVATAGLYNRVWDHLTPFEPAHGPARLTVAQPPSLHVASANFGSTMVLLPDGRLWEGRFNFIQPAKFSFLNPSLSVFEVGRWTLLRGARFLEGSNWMDVAPLSFQTVAIRSNGTLWVSDRSAGNQQTGTNGPWVYTPSGRLAQMGQETNWKSLAPARGTESVVILRSNGTLWLWSEAGPARPGSRPWLISSTTDWSNMVPIVGDGLREFGWMYAWRSNGTTYSYPFKMPPNDRYANATQQAQSYGETNLSGTSWRSIATLRQYSLEFHAGVRDDGSLWVWGPLNLGRPAQRKQIGTDTNWVSVTSDRLQFVGLKSDGTLWRWVSDTMPVNGSYQQVWPDINPPERMGIHNDWVAVSSGLQGIVSLAADGSLWYWWNPDRDQYSWDGRERFLAPPSKPVRLCNIFDQE